MKKLLGFLACLAVVLGTFLANAPAASAATGVISNGIAWTPNASYPGLPGMTPDKPLGDYCTLAVVGTDNSGNKVAISAAHCVSVEGANYVPDGSPIYSWTPNNGPREHIGTIAYRSWNGTGYPVPASQSNNPGAFGTDYVVIKLNNDAVLTSNGPGVRIDGLGSSNPSGVMCKDGQSTGVTCGWITGQNATRIFNLGLIGPGDSGGPAYQGTNIVGYNRSWNGGTFEYVKFSAVLAEINSPGSPSPIGKGFVVTNN
ncbi:S1 family peptidase [Rhodococcus qingshengii]|uniref:S1 family peptidase n=1 Tax=Rhodococcus qingshengii TaxID=334542 RepID=UPI001BE558A7|nr:S1 family peptidase [Rhodococcus qingshengii]MBT2270662.1 hypothetical protein [Rhodococcus qingshengii]